MAVVGLDHLVVNTRDVEGSISFYRDVLGMEILRLDEFREGKVGFVSARVSQEIIIDIRPTKSEDAVTPNMDHFFDREPRFYKATTDSIAIFISRYVPVREAVAAS